MRTGRGQIAHNKGADIRACGFHLGRDIGGGLRVARPNTDLVDGPHGRVRQGRMRRQGAGPADGQGARVFPGQISRSQRRHGRGSSARQLGAVNQRFQTPGVRIEHQHHGVHRRQPPRPVVGKHGKNLGGDVMARAKSGHVRHAGALHAVNRADINQLTPRCQALIRVDPPQSGDQFNIGQRSFNGVRVDIAHGLLQLRGRDVMRVLVFDSRVFVKRLSGTGSFTWLGKDRGNLPIMPIANSAEIKPADQFILR